MADLSPDKNYSRDVEECAATLMDFAPYTSDRSVKFRMEQAAKFLRELNKPVSSTASTAAWKAIAERDFSGDAIKKYVAELEAERDAALLSARASTTWHPVPKEDHGKILEDTQTLNERTKYVFMWCDDGSMWMLELPLLRRDAHDDIHDAGQR